MTKFWFWNFIEGKVSKCLRIQIQCLDSSKNVSERLENQLLLKKNFLSLKLAG